MAHANIRLVLLHPCPDTVHGITLHKPLLSTFLTARKPSINLVSKGVQLCYSGLQIQGAATSPPTRSLFIIHHFLSERNRFCPVFLPRLCIIDERFCQKFLYALKSQFERLTKFFYRGIIINNEGERICQKIVRIIAQPALRVAVHPEKKKAC